MTEYVFYYPILKWKQGEYKALHSLNPQIKDRIDVIKIGDDEVYDIYSEQLCKIFNIFDWHTTIIAGSSFPEEMTDGTLNNRYEWNLYDNFLKKFAITSKEPKFSDYYILNPEHSFLFNKVRFNC